MQEKILEFIRGESERQKIAAKHNKEWHSKAKTYAYHKDWLLEQNMDSNADYYIDLAEFVKEKIGGNLNEIKQELIDGGNLFKFVMKTLDKELEDISFGQFFETDDDTFVYSRGETYKIEDWEKREQLCH
jgi:hypothetical protein